MGVSFLSYLPCWREGCFCLVGIEVMQRVYVFTEHSILMISAGLPVGSSLSLVGAKGASVCHHLLPRALYPVGPLGASVYIEVLGGRYP